MPPEDLYEVLSNSEILRYGVPGERRVNDAEYFQISEATGIIATIDAIAPPVDNPEIYGRAAALHSISDIYAVGGTPLVAQAILGWPVDTLSNSLAGQVMRGVRLACQAEGVELVGGHSIVASEPFVGLAVQGIPNSKGIIRTSGAKAGDHVYLTGRIGSGLMSVALKHDIVLAQDLDILHSAVLDSNSVGKFLCSEEVATAMTDISGFGLIGHLSSIAMSSNVSINLHKDRIPVFDNMDYYIANDAISYITINNIDFFGRFVRGGSYRTRLLLFHPQTNGPLCFTTSEPISAELLSRAPEGTGDICLVGSVLRADKHGPCINII